MAGNLGQTRMLAFFKHRLLVYAFLVLVSGEKNNNRVIFWVIQFRMLENLETRSHLAAVHNKVSIINGDFLKDSRVCSLTEKSFTGLSMSQSNGVLYWHGHSAAVVAGKRFSLGASTYDTCFLGQWKKHIEYQNQANILICISSSLKYIEICEELANSIFTLSNWIQCRYILIELCAIYTWFAS